MKPLQRIPNLKFPVDIKQVIYTRPNHNFTITLVNKIKTIIICRLFLINSYFTGNDSYVQLTNQSKQTYCKYFIMNIIREYRRDQMQHRKTKRNADETASD